MNDCPSALYSDILREELIPALGCTEPIAIALAAARAREALGTDPSAIVVRCSGNIIKNVKSVYVPNTGGLKGIPASALAGMVAGDSSKGMQVLAHLNDADRRRIHELLSMNICRTEMFEGEEGLHIRVTMTACNVSTDGGKTANGSANGGDTALAEIIHTHTNFCRVERNGKVLFHKDCNSKDYTSVLTDRSVLTIAGIYEFAKTADIGPLEELLDLQISDNTAIAKEGLANKYGLNVGSAIKEVYGDSLWANIRASAAAGSDARMGGCSLPVVINSGSGNQGLTTSLPVITYARHCGADKETLYRAMVLSNLVTIRLKTGIGRLSAYCGAMSASAGSSAGITFLAGGTLAQIDAAITNTLACVSGIVCDGAKASCAAKIATGLDAAIIGHHLAMKGKAYEPGCGIVKNDVEQTVDAVGRLGRVGMRETDAEILRIMLDK